MYVGKPKNTEDYLDKEANGLTVFVPKNARLKKEGLNIDLVGFGPFKQLVIEGFVI